MSESPNSRMFEFAAMRNGAKQWARCRLVLMLLVVLCICGLRSMVAEAQTVQTSIDIKNFDGNTVFRLDLYGENSAYAFNGGLVSYRDFYGDEIAALSRGLQYWTEIVMPHGQPITPVVVRAGVFWDTSMNAGAYGIGNANGTLAYNILGMGVDPGLEPSGVAGDEIEGFHALMRYNNTWWGYDPNTQLMESIRSLEPVMIHEFGHAMGIASTTPRWAELLQGGLGNMVFTGPTASRVYGDGVVRHVPMTHLAGAQEDSHLGIQNGLMTHHQFRNYSGFTEVEMAALLDLGYTKIDLRNFFGRSVYTDGNTIVNTTGYYESRGLDGADNWRGYNVGVANTSSHGLGLHVYGSNNTITQRADILSVGTAGGGIRVDGFNNTIIVDANTNIHVNGDGGTGLLVAFGTGHKIIHRGDIQSNGRGVPEFGPATGVRFDFGPPMFDPADRDGRSYGWVYGNEWDWNIIELDGPLVAQFDVTGSISGTDAAIFIAENAHVQMVNFMNGTSIKGDVISDYVDGGRTTTLTFGKLAATDGSAFVTVGVTGNVLYASDHANYEIPIVGNIGNNDGDAANFTIETWGGTTKVDGNVNVRSGVIGLGNANSILALLGDATFAGAITPNTPQTLLVTRYGTLGALSNVTVNGDFLVEDGGTLMVALGNTDYDRVTVTGTATFGDVGGTGARVNLLTAFGGTHTLVTAGTLQYEGNASVLFNGRPIGAGIPIDAGAGRKFIDNFDVEQVDNTLLLTIGLASNANATERTRLIWTGMHDGTTWSNNVEHENWMTFDGVGEVWFLDGDGVQFNLDGTHIINIDNTGGARLVADMTVSGTGNWTFNGDILGDAVQSPLDDATGMLVMAGTGVLALNGDTEFRGGALVGEFDENGKLVAAGTLQIGNGGDAGSIANDIENHGEVVFNRSSRVVFEHDIFGTGSLVQRGTGETILRGDGTTTYLYEYGGATTVENGALLVSNLAGTSALNVRSGATFQGLYDTTDVTVAGTVDNRGEISHIGTFSVTGNLDNHNGRIHRIDTIIAEGAVNNFGQMENIKTVDVSRELVNTGIIRDVGKIIAGESANYNNVFVTNTNTGRIINVGEIHTNGFVNQGYIVSGEEMLIRLARDPDPQALLPRGTLVNDRGTLVVGTVNSLGSVNGIGTLTVDGNFHSTQGTFSVVVNESTGGSSKINVVNGNATIDGGRVNVVLDGSPIALNKQYTFLDVEDGQLYVNPYSPLVASSLEDPLIQLGLVYDENSYWISLSRTFIYTGEGDTTNQRIMGRYTDLVGEDLFAGNPSGDLRTVLLALDNSRLTARTQMDAMSTMSIMSTASEASVQQVWSEHNDPLDYALDQMSGSIYGTATTASFQNTVMMHTSLANVLRRDYNTINAINAHYGRSNPVPAGNLWGMLYGHAGSSKHDGNVNGYRQGFHGIMAGIDRLNDRRLRLGLFLSAGNGSLSSDLRDRSLSSEFMLGHYVRRDTNHGYLLFQAGLGNHRYETRRELTFIDRTANNRHGAFLITAHTEAGLRYRNSILNLSPFVGAQFTGLVREGFTERNAGSLNLTADMEGYNSFRTMFGMRFDSVPLRIRNGLASFYGNVAWMYEFESGDRHTKFSARFTDAGLFSGQSFTVHGNDPGRDWVQAGFGLNYDVNSRLRGFAGYDAYANQRQVLHSANIGFTWQK